MTTTTTPRGLAHDFTVGALWYLAWAAFVPFPPLVGLFVVLAVGGAFAWRYLLRAGDLRRRARLALRAPRAAGWVAAAIGAYIALELALLVLYVWLEGPPPPSPAGVFERYEERPLGWLPLVALYVVIAPLMEEYVFRGVLLRALERRVGAFGAVAGTTVAFAVVHFRPWGLPIYLLFGVVAGLMVYASRSLWAAIALHAAANAAAPVEHRVLDALTGTPIPAHRTTALVAAALVASASLLFLALWRTWRGRRPRSVGAPARPAGLSGIPLLRTP